MTGTRVSTWRRWRYGAVAFAGGYGLLRLFWSLGGRTGYSACDRTSLPGPAEIATGCGADGVASLPFWQGWGAVALSGALVVVAVTAALRRGNVPAAAAWSACVVLIALSFPGHLLFEIPAAMSGRPADLRDLGHRLVLLTGGLLFGVAAAATRTARCGHAPATGPRPVPPWVRRWAYAAFAVPVLGFTVPHALWLLGMPVGISADDLGAVRADIDPVTGLWITAAPTLGGLLTLGLAHRWGQVFPRWLPGLADRRVPRLLALVPSGVVAVALTSYGLIGIWLMAAALASGDASWADLASGWAVVLTELVFLGWGVALAVATLGYHRLTRPRCGRCEPGSAVTD